MSWFKRIFLFLAVNILVMLTISLILNFLGIGRHFYTNYGIDYQQLAAFCLVYGMVGSFFSLAISRIMAKWMMGVKVIDASTHDPELRELVVTVHRLAHASGLRVMPQVGIYDSPELNAFATGPTKSRALVAVSTGLLQRMSKREVEGVLGHEIAHVANGDMVTMTLIQGIINAFVMFLSRVLAYFITQAMRGNRDSDEREDSPVGGMAFFAIQFVLEIALMILGSMVVAAFSRWREYRADKGGAALAGRENMIQALQALRRAYEIVDPRPAPAVETMKISSHPKGIFRLFSTHPPLEERIARLQQLT